MTEIGHNSGADEHLSSLVERIKNLEGEKAALQSDIKDCYAEAKSAGYDVKALRKAISVESRGVEKYVEERDAAENYLRNLRILD